MIRSFIIMACSVLFSLGAWGQKKPPAKTSAIKKPGTMGSSGLAASIMKGKSVYIRTCLTCHQKDGGGVQNMNPPLTNTSYVKGDKQKLISIVLNGISHQEIDGDTYNNVMPPLNNKLSDEDVANVLTYVRRSFGNRYSAVTAKEVKAVRDKK
jgi:mono/diheme cytochrome c family protein